MQWQRVARAHVGGGGAHGSAGDFRERRESMSAAVEGGVIPHRWQRGAARVCAGGEGGGGGGQIPAIPALAAGMRGRR